MSSILPALHRACFNDVIFEGRNKAYGAYELRLVYPSHLKRAVVAVLVFCAALSAGPTVLGYFYHPAALVPTPAAAKPEEYKLKTVAPELEKLPPPVQAAQPKPPVEVATRRLVTRTVVADHRVQNEEEQLSMEDANKTPVLGLQNIEGPAVIAPPVEQPVVVAPPAADVIFDGSVEQMPEFPGGNAALLRYVSARIKYPALALRSGVEGRVYVRFVVDETGQVVNPTVVKGIGAGCDEEALRVIRSLPRFTPGQQNGRPVKVYFNLPLAFQIK